MSIEKIYYEGNVGIGTQTPTQPLQVIGDIAVGHHWEGANKTAGIKIGKPDVNGGWGIASAFIQFQDSKANGVNKGTSIAFHTHQWGTGTNEALRIAANGNVGIGSSDPDHELDVDGTINAREILVDGQPLMTSGDPIAVGVSSVHPNFKLQAKGGSGSWKGGIASGGENSAVVIGELSGKATVGAHNGALGGWTDLILSPEGNVGIGTSAPAHKLDVDGTINAREVLINGQPLTAGGGSQPGGTGAPGDTLAIGAPSVHPNFKLQVQGGAAAWKGGIASGGTKSAVVVGELGGKATIGGHAGSLNNWADLILSPEGNVGIGTATPAEKLDVAGNIHCHGTVAQNSDGRLKKAIQPIASALNKVIGLRGVNYLWKDAARGNDTQMGLIAQEVEAVLPEAVCTDTEGNKSITYGNLTAVLIEAVKEQQKQIEALKERVTKLTMAT